jgi:transcription factor SPN1
MKVTFIILLKLVSKVILENNNEEEEEIEENFDKEFEDLDEEEEKETKKKKVKKHKRRKSDEEEILDIKKEKGRRKTKEIDEDKLRDEIAVFMGKLREAVEIDRQNFEKKKPALEKFKLVNTIDKFLSNYYHQKAFLNENGLEILQEWIKRNPDKTYPALNQISLILDILTNLNVNLHHLKNCYIGGYVMDISKNMTISKSIQKKARDLIEKWSRIVWDINTNYADIDSENRVYQMIYSKKRNRSEDEEDSDVQEEVHKKKDGDIHKEDIYSHAKIPKKALFDFTIKPSYNLTETKVNDTSKIKLNYFSTKTGSGKKKKE